jgi:hypothetical protein
MNNLNLQFGGAPSDKESAVGIGFIAAPMMQPDFSVALLESFKFAKENSDALREYVLANSFNSTKIKLKLTYDGTNLLTTTTGLGAFSISDTANQIPVVKSNYVLKALNSTISVNGVQRTNSESWGVGITPGTVYRTYTIPEYEQSDIWFRSIPELAGSGAIGKQCLLIYSVPEANYCLTQSSNDDTFPGTDVKYKKLLSKVVALGPSTIELPNKCSKILSITVNNLIKYNSTVGAEYIKSIDQDLGKVEVKDTLDSDSSIFIEYLTYLDEYVYLGYRDNVKNTYFPLDLNPEYGHVIGDDRFNIIRSSSTCLLEHVTIFAIPSAVATFSVDDTLDSSGLKTLEIKFYSGYSYGETHFVRHAVGAQVEEIIPKLSEGPANTYGFALFGRNYYDENSVPKRDIFSRKIPSMLPLGRALLRAPLNVNAVKIADIRVRGGGVPDEFDFNKINSEPDALTTLKSYYDLGIWDGQPVQEGGLITVKIDPSVLVVNGGEFTEPEVDEIVRQRIPPGIKFELVFEDVT